MKKARIMLLVGALSLSVSGCSFTPDASEAAGVDEQYLGESIENNSIFPASVEGFVGDTMPFYSDGKFNVFYLADQRNGKQGYHPWALIQTENFSSFDDKGVVINYGDSVESQDIALGTGSVIKDNSGVYHAFYTGHNDTFEPKEAVMHATSKDMENWEKIPADTFTSGGNYSANDFRDPYVFYSEEEDCYEMLVTTRANNMGVIARFSSKDLSKWKDEGVFFENDLGSDSNMECPTLLEYKGKWYLSFSDQWPLRETHYRVADKWNGPFEKPKQDVFDGNGFYAGRMETDGEKLYVVGWNGTKKNHTDSEDYDWGGNLVCHELKQTKNGNLVPVLNTDVQALLNHEIALNPIKMTDSVKEEKDVLKFSGNQYEVVGYDRIMGSYLFQTTIKDFDKKGMFGFCFNNNTENVGNTNIVFNAANSRIEFYNTSDIMESTAQSYIDYDIAGCDELQVSILISDGVVVMYVNDEVAFTSRMYLSQGMEWGLFSINSKVNFEATKLYK